MIIHPHRSILGPIPDDWDTIQLQKCLAVSTAGNWGDEHGEVTLPVLRSTNFTDSRELDLRDVALRGLSKKDAAKFTLLRGDILVERSGGGPAQPVGRVVVLDRDLPSSAFSNFVQLLRVDKEVMNPDYVSWCLYRLHACGIVERLQHQTTQMRNLDIRDYVRVRLPRPSSEEQQLIANSIQLVDESIRAAKTELDKAQRLKTALLQQLFTKGLSGRFDSLSESKWLICPSHWKRVQLRRIAKVEAGFTMGRDLRGKNTVEVPYLTVVNVLEGRLSLNEVSSSVIKVGELETGLLAIGDVLMTEGGDRDKLGRGCIWNGEIERCAYQNHIFRVRFDPGTLNPLLFHFLLQSSQAKRYFFSHAKQTSNLCTINSRELKQFEVPLPPDDEQREMVNIFLAAEDFIHCVEQKIVATEREKCSLLTKLLTGHIRLHQVVKPLHVARYGVG
jgi:type I restriction enzyme, S subunit